MSIEDLSDEELAQEIIEVLEQTENSADQILRTIVDADSASALSELTNIEEKQIENLLAEFRDRKGRSDVVEIVRDKVSNSEKLQV